MNTASKLIMWGVIMGVLCLADIWIGCWVNDVRWFFAFFSTGFIFAVASLALIISGVGSVIG